MKQKLIYVSIYGGVKLEKGEKPDPYTGVSILSAGDWQSAAEAFINLYFLVKPF
jgi:hypothetical protein